jgi:single-strand DNA-binding protein|tara:strand:- start:606 stop:1028 length:423 start_codon:yes stop_codon:yes gene_type:complete
MTINKAILLGNLGADPEIKITTANTKFARLNIATNERFKDKEGNVQEKTQWHNVVIFDPMVAETVEKYCKKGQTLYIEGSIETRKYEQDGQVKYTTEILIAKFKGMLKMIGKPDGAKSSTESPTKEQPVSHIDTKGDIPF